MSSPYGSLDPSVRASDVTPEGVTWFWEERIPRAMLTTVAGRPGQGKSLLGVHLSAEASHQGVVLLANLEDPFAHVTRPRLEAAGADLDNVRSVDDFRLPRDLELIERLIVKHQAVLLVVDPANAVLGKLVNQDGECRQVLTPFTAMLARHGCTAVFVTHTKKTVSKSSHPLEAIGGSGGGLVAASRAVFIWGPNPHDPAERLLAPAKQNLGEERPCVAFEIDSVEIETVRGGTAAVGTLRNLGELRGVSTNEVLAFNGDAAGIAPAKKALAAEWITTYLSGGEQPAAQLKEDAVADGISWATIRRAADEIGIVRGRKGFGKGSHVTWQLPEGHPALQAAAAPASNSPDDDAEVEVAELTANIDDELNKLLGGGEGS